MTLLLCIGVPYSAAGQRKSVITPAVAFAGPSPQFTSPLPAVTGWQDDGRYIERKTSGPDSGRTVLVDAHTGRITGRKPEPVDPDSLAALLPKGLSFRRRAAADDVRAVYVYQHENDLHVLDGPRRSFRRLTNSPEEEKNPVLSPDGTRLAFTRMNDLVVVDLESGAERRLTTDGSETILNGFASWVYWEEIFGRATRNRAFWWSPDGSRLAFFRFDDTRVPTQPLFDNAGQHGRLRLQRYPKAGDPNPEARLAVADVRTGEITWAEFDPAVDQYLGTPFWLPDGSELLAQWMNRGQDTLILYGVNPSTGKKRIVTLEHQPAWVDWYEEITFLRGGAEFILRSDRDGWAHFYRFDRSGKLLNRITSGEWAVESITHVNEAAGTLWFTAKREASTRSDLYTTGLDGSGLRRLTFGPYTHSVQPSPGGSWFITTYSNVATPHRMALVDAAGGVIRELGDSRTPLLDEYDLARTEIIRISTGDGWSIPASITLPASLEPGRRYPVLLSTYGGPLDASVADRWGLSMTTQGLAAEGLISVTIDHRGSGHHGKKGAALMHRRLGTWEIHDYIEAVRWLRRQPWVDSTRICITGGSYGGYVTALALTAGAEYFTHGVASFPVVDWLLYDSHYTERYMDSPAENPEGYREASVLAHAHAYRGLLRLVEGGLDDNTHLQNTMQLADTLQTLGRHFELMVYPSRGHGIVPPQSEHARVENLRFTYRHLLGKPMPPEALQTRARTMSPH